MQRYFSFLLFFLNFNCLPAQLPSFEAEIHAFERLDSIEKSAKDPILLYGSSTMLKKYCRKHRKRAFFIDAYKLLLTPDGKPNPEYLDPDELHLNAKGYEVWAKVTRDFLKKQGL